MRKFLIAVLLAVVPGTGAQAATYVGTRNAGAATATLSVTTDDTLGVLRAANILDWTIRLTLGANTSTLFGPDSGDTSAVQVRGTQLTATATNLLFNFSGPLNSYLLFQSNVGDRSLYCVQTTNCFDQNQGEEIINLGPTFTVFDRDLETGVQVLASVTPAVPEPASWAMMMLGFGCMGYAMRRTNRVSTRIRFA